MSTRPLPLILLVVALLASCGAPGEELPPSRQLTAEEQLPDEYRDAWRAWYEDAPDWSEWRERVAADPRLARFLVDNLVRVMVRFYDHSAVVKAGDLPGYFERSQRELLWMHEESAPVLLELVLVGDGVVAFLAGDLLVRIDDPRWSLAVAGRLSEPEPEQRRRAAALLAKLPHAQREELEVLERLGRCALEDPEWFVRAEAVGAIGARALVGSDHSRSRKVLSLALSDGDRAVVLAACKALAETEDVGAVPALMNLLERLERGDSGDVTVLRAAEAALRRISGRADLNGAQAWRQWWRENRP
jgi:hypothetical protein